MKKLLFSILTFLWIWFSFCGAFDISEPWVYFWSFWRQWDEISSCREPIVFKYDWTCSKCYFSYILSTYWNWISDSSSIFNPSYDFSFSPFCSSDDWYYIITFVDLDNTWEFHTFWWSSSSDITVFYNSWSSTTITCDWTQAIEIQWLSTITSTNTFTPYFNISYTDEDNQKLTESYSKDILYLENWQFKKTFTWNNDWILSVQWGLENSFSWYLPTFEITWWINEPTESWNIFNNFAENSLKFTLSNIPSYIQYVILLFILFFILGFIRKFRRK